MKKAFAVILVLVLTAGCFVVSYITEMGVATFGRPNNLWMWYGNQNGPDVDLIRMPNALNTNINGIEYTFQGTQRRFCNTETFAAFIGALSQYGRAGFICTGVSFRDATGYPSFNHSNGVSIDSVYYGNQADIRLVNAFRNWYFTEIIAGDDRPHLNSITRPCIHHRDHLHLGICRPDVDNLLN
jgi:hypothetical protein